MYCVLIASALFARAQTTPMSVQGRVTVDGVAFDGVGKFKFALFQSAGGAQLWSHDGTASGTDSQPTTFIQLSVVRGVYSVLLGDPLVPGMTQPINPAIFTNADVRLRVWFDDGSHGFQRLQPDQRLASVGYAMRAERAAQAAVLTGNVTIDQVPSILVTNTESGVTLTGQFIGDGSLLSGIRGSTPFQIATNGTNIVFPNTGYLTTNLAETVFLLPATADMRVGDLVRVAAGDPGPWRIAQRADQSIFAGHLEGGIGAKWVARDVNRNWNALAISSNGMVAFGMGKTMNPSIYVSTNGGLNWIAPPLPPQKDWNCVAASADGSRAVAGANSSTLYVSSDIGQSWNARSAPGTRVWSAVAMSANGSNVMAVATGAVWGSVDGGDNWVVRSGAPTLSWVGCAMSADGSRQVITGDKIYLSRNGGTNWFISAAPAVAYSQIASSQDGERLVVIGGSGANLSLYTSIDGGTNWTARTGAGTRAFLNVACSADGTKIVATVNGGQIYVSVDGGGSWTPRATASVWSDIAISTDGKRIFAPVLAGQIYISDAVPTRSTTLGVDGYLSGGEASSIELQHVGNGRFIPRSFVGEIFAY